MTIIIELRAAGTSVAINEEVAVEKLEIKGKSLKLFDSFNSVEDAAYSLLRVKAQWIM